MRTSLPAAQVSDAGCVTASMTALRSLMLAALLLAVAATPASAVVGGRDAGAGEYPSVAEIRFGPFLCTGTLIAPTWVLSAGHCSSVTGAAVASPAAWPPQAISVRLGGVTQDDGETVPVARAIVHPDYRLTSGYDISLLQLARPSAQGPTPVAGAAERSLWNAGTLETIVGWGATSEGGSTPDRLQEAEVPVTTDAYCDTAYADGRRDRRGHDGLRRLPPGRGGHLPGRFRRARCSAARCRRAAGGGRHELRRGLRAGRLPRCLRARGGQHAERLDRRQRPGRRGRRGRRRRRRANELGERTRRDAAGAQAKRTRRPNVAARPGARGRRGPSADAQPGAGRRASGAPAESTRARRSALV